MDAASSPSFLARNEFLIRRLFSLCGLVPVGAYMVIHLLTNAALFADPTGAPFQRAVNNIHMLDLLLPVVEWVFIFIPIIFHAVIGIVIVRGSLPNTATYKYASNVQYTLQRATGLIAFAFIFLHVFHMHGWLHADWWLGVAKNLGGARFSPYNASSSTAQAFQGAPGWTVFYIVGVLSCVYHLSNGIWSAGIRWGVWTSPKAMKRAAGACVGFGVLLAVLSTAALWAPHRIDIDKAIEVENQMFREHVFSEAEAERARHKRSEAGLARDDKPAAASTDSRSTTVRSASADRLSSGQ